MRNSIDRFNDRVTNYVRHRPSYPASVFDVLKRATDWTPASVVADIGSGTGISSKLFLERGNKVFGIEPNAAMRAAAEDFLRDFPAFESVGGTAEQTGLATDTADLVVAAQAYHWFDSDEARAEFARIVKPGGHLALIWNERLLDATEFLAGFEALLIEFATDYQTVRHDRFNLSGLTARFGNDIFEAALDNVQSLDFEGLKGRVASSSYIPTEDDPRYQQLCTNLRSLFDKYAEDGRIQILYKTKIFCTKL